MKVRIGAGRRTAPRSVPAALWITDDVLAEAFQRFACVPVRHGSHVPGPLEARRRAAKRRNTHLAHAGGLSRIDPTVLFSKTSQHGWWNDTSATNSKDSTSFLPSWLLGTRKPAFVNLATQNDTVPDFEGDLACCDSVSDLRSLTHDHGLNLRLDVAQAESIYEHVMNKDWPAIRLAEYLTEPALHPPGCNNHVRFLRSCGRDLFVSDSQSPEVFQDWATILRSVQKAVQLGLLSTQECMQAVEATLTITNLFNGVNTHDAPYGWAVKAPSAIIALLDSLKQCPLLSLQDIEPHWLGQLPRRVISSGFNVEMAKLIQCVGLERSSTLVRELLVAHLVAQPQRPEAAYIVEALLSLPQFTILKAMGQTTDALAAGVLAGNLDPIVLSAWATILRAFHNEGSARLSFSKSDLKNLSPASAAPGERSRRSLLYLWMLHQLLTPASMARLLPNLRHMLRTAVYQSPADVHRELLTTLKTLPLPHKDKLIADLPRILNIRVGYELSELEAGMAHILQGDLALLAHDATYGYMKKHHQTSLTEAAERVNQNVPAFKRLIRYTVSANKLSFKIWTRTLRNNVAFGTALSYSWSQRLRVERETRAVPPSDEREAVAPASENRHIDPEQALDIMHILAVSFSASTAAKPRSALQKVYWCYRTLLKFGAPIQPPMVRALWHAGVTRFENRVDSNGCSNAQLAWILRKVSEVEGHEVAMQLLRNADFRRARARAIESIARGKSLSSVEQDCEIAGTPSPPLSPGSPAAPAARRKVQNARGSRDDTEESIETQIKGYAETIERRVMEIAAEEVHERARRASAFDLYPVGSWSEEGEAAPEEGAAGYNDDV